MNNNKQKVLRFLPMVALVVPLCCFSAQAQNAPNAGGYAGENGSDFGVGRTVVKGVREPIAVVGFSARTSGGTALPWLGLRFADELSNVLRAPMRASAKSDGVAQWFAARDVRFWQAGDWKNSTLGGKPQLPPAARALSSTPTYRSSFPLWIVGEAVVRGVPSSLDSTVRLQLRAVRWQNNGLTAASSPVALEAPLREWPQLPTRAALALLDGLRVPLTEEERTSFLRAASPLQPPATAQQLSSEIALGTMQFSALESQVLSRKSARADLLAAKAHGRTAVRALRVTLKSSDQKMAARARSWQAYVLAAARVAETRARAAASRKRG
ncbi:MAG TPA: hypothetical protein VF681_09335 [Abditibacteriaceae bacterium]|jgi:hypothetical protein